jgi:hypothetical protein
VLEPGGDEGRYGRNNDRTLSAVLRLPNDIGQTDQDVAEHERKKSWPIGSAALDAAIAS